MHHARLRYCYTQSPPPFFLSRILEHATFLSSLRPAFIGETATMAKDSDKNDRKLECKSAQVTSRKAKHKHRKKKTKKQKRSITSNNCKVHTQQDHASPRKFLNGMIVAVSTLELDNNAPSDNKSSYSSVTERCLEAGAKVSGQVHKRVACLLCTHSAVQNTTQRVRKAYKKNIPIVEVGWLDKCRIEGKMIDFESFRLENETKVAIDKRINSSLQDGKDSYAKKTIQTIENEDEEIPENCMSKTVDLGCCCVCHENGTADKCEWCVDCKI